MNLSDLALAAQNATPSVQVAAFTRWVGTGRKLTDTGRLTLADARHLVSMLDTGDEMDRTIGDRTYRTRSSEDLPALTVIATWAKAAGLVRTQNGRLVAVKKNAALLNRPLDLWCALFDAFDEIGDALCPARWLVSLVKAAFPEGVAAIFAGLARNQGSLTLAEAGEQVWQTLSRRFRLDDAEEWELDELRQRTNDDVSLVIGTLVALGALDAEGPVVSISPLGDWALRRPYTISKASEPVASLTVILEGIEPRIWRRVLVPSKIRLDRLHDVIQAAMGWQNYHLHVFISGDDTYGQRDDDDDFELGHRDERGARLDHLLRVVGDSMHYEYDFGDGWGHDIVLEDLLPVEADRRYPVCLDGERACPPEDCGGAPGYAELIQAIADPRHPDHKQLRASLDRRGYVAYDPARFDASEANARLDSVIRSRPVWGGRQ
jgi:hypothetical protein